MSIPDWAREQQQRAEQGDPDVPLEELIEPDAGEITEFHPYKPDGLRGILDYGLSNLATEWALAFEPSAKAQEGILKSRLPENYRVEYSPTYDATIVQGPEGERGFVNRPGVSQRDFTNFGALMGAFVPAGKAYGLGGGPARGGLLSATAAMGTEALRQRQSEAFGSEAAEANLIPGIDLPEVATAGVTQFLPDYLMGRLSMGKIAPGVPPDLGERVAANQQAATTSGIQAMRGQLASDVATELEDLRTLGQLPETSPAIGERFADQNVQAQEAVSRLVGNIEASDMPPSRLLEGPEGVAPTGTVYTQEPSERFKSAAEQLRGGLTEFRAQSSRELYEQATGRTDELITTELYNNVGEIMREVAPGGEAYKKLDYIRRVAAGEPKVDVIEGMELIEDPTRTVSQLHDAKQELDAMIEKAVENGNQSLVMRLERAQDDLVDFVQLRSPIYKEARETFSRLSAPINEFDESILGTVQRMDPQNAFRLGELIFNPRLPNRTRALIQQRLQLVDPYAFRLLAGDVIRTRMSRIADVSPGDVENVPYKINQTLFKNQQEREMWKAAFPERADEIDALSRALQIASRGRHAGSPTATRQLVMRERGYEATLPSTLAEATADLLKWLSVVPKASEAALSGARQTMQTQARMRGLQRQLTGTPEEITQEYISKGQNVPWITAMIQGLEGRAD